MRRLLVLGLVALQVSIVGALGAVASDFEDKEIGKFMSNGDVYLIEENPRVLEPVEGDLFLLGNNIVIKENVAEDLFVVGNEIIIDGDVGGDVRILGNTVTINGNVEEDLLVTASKVLIADGAIIGGSVYGIAEDFVLHGYINSHFYFEGRSLKLHGLVSGEVEAKVHSFWMGPSSTVGGNLRYSAKEDAQIQKNFVLGDIVFTKTDELRGAEWFVIKMAWKAFSFVNNAVLALVLLLIMPKFLIGRGNDALKRPLLTFGAGLFAVLGLMFIPILMFGTFVGVKLGFAMLFSLGLLFLLGSTLGAMWIALAIIGRSKKEVTRWPLLGMTVLCLLGLSLISIIPGIGWVVVFMVMLFGIGGMLQMPIGKSSRKKK
ncbi:hypothetical protein CVV38_01935 [Candidatus Peregrinibacteria bacterium HGW-Peregrinibacteria-1]|jgi:cytoskeletal protein CcmA (bactofilin family)|nr:MAG: hypothetical protein CVV38_01935 [Candidatus Peregrinibacteria bacterium HGW-Peregrinibacteria-1]